MIRGTEATAPAGAAESPGPTSSPAGADGAAFVEPAAVALGSDGTAYVADGKGQRVWRVPPDGRTEPFLGTGNRDNAGFGGPAAQASISFPAAVVAGGDGTVYVGGDGHLLRIGTDRVARPVTGFGDGYLGVKYLALSGEGLFVGADDEILLRRDDGTVAPFTDTIDGLEGIAVHPAGGIVYAAGDRVFQVASAGAEPVPVAGSATESDAEGDGRAALATNLSGPTGLAFDSEGRLHFAEAGEGRVRRLERDGKLLTVVGNPGSRGSASGDAGDGGPGSGATFGLIVSLGFDRDGRLYIVDKANHRVRRVAPEGERRIQAFP